SKGNIVDPLAIIGKYGCDALRFTLTALAAQGRDVKLAESRIEGYRNFATKLWNAARFAEMNECKLDPSFDPAKTKLTLNRWIAGALAQAALRATEALEAFEFNAAAETLYHFTWGTFCDWYVEFSKPLLTSSDAAAKAETRAVTAWVLGRLVHLLHPIMPFVTEELWKHLADGKGGLLIQSQWPALDAGLVNRDAAAEMDWVVALIAQIRTARAEMNVPPAQEIAAYVTESGGDEKDWLVRHDTLIRRLARLKRIHPVDATAPAKQNTIQVVVEGASLLLDFAGAIDVGKERARLQKEAQGIRAELDKIAAKLGNEQFLAKAKAEAIDEQRERQAEARAALTRLDAALARIGGA
ncbi:MAG: class I tRNA ligase family protein, partial [Stellaceae bacterium]